MGAEHASEELLRRRTGAAFALASAVAVVGTDVLYSFMVSGENVSDAPRVRFEILYIAGLAAAVTLGAMAPWPRARVMLLGFAAAGLLLDGLIAIFSVGVLLILTGLLTAVALEVAIHDRPGRMLALALPAGVLSAVFLFAGLALFPLN